MRGLGGHLGTNMLGSEMRGNSIFRDKHMTIYQCYVLHSTLKHFDIYVVKGFTKRF